MSSFIAAAARLLDLWPTNCLLAVLLTVHYCCDQEMNFDSNLKRNVSIMRVLLILLSCKFRTRQQTHSITIRSDISSVSPMSEFCHWNFLPWDPCPHGSSKLRRWISSSQPYPASDSSIPLYTIRPLGFSSLGSAHSISSLIQLLTLVV